MFPVHLNLKVKDCVGKSHEQCCAATPTRMCSTPGCYSSFSEKIWLCWRLRHFSCAAWLHNISWTHHLRQWLCIQEVICSLQYISPHVLCWVNKNHSSLKCISCSQLLTIGVKDCSESTSLARYLAKGLYENWEREFFGRAGEGLLFHILSIQII